MLVSAYSILIADDDAGCRGSVQEVLNAEGYRTRVAASGEEAVEIVRRDPVNLSILDWHMPDMTGVEILREIRVLVRDMYCIIMTSDDSEDVDAEAKACGVFTVLRKPLQVATVRGTVRGVVSMSMVEFGQGPGSA